jgi:hypothetical protein
MRSIGCARNAAGRFPLSYTRWPTRMRRSYARIAGRAATATLRRLPNRWRGRDPSEESLRGWFRIVWAGAHFPRPWTEELLPSCLPSCSLWSDTAKRQFVARLPFLRPGHPTRMEPNMSDDKLDLLCEDCGQTFSDFLHEMADQNAKVTTCPKCGKIHEFPSKTAKAGARSVKKIV